MYFLCVYFLIRSRYSYIALNINTRAYIYIYIYIYPIGFNIPFLEVQMRFLS